MKGYPKSQGHIRRDTSGNVICLLSYGIMGLFGLFAVVPFLHVISKGISGASAVTSGAVLFWPVDFQLETVWFVMTETIYLQALFNSVIVTVFGTIASMLVSITTAYPLSKVRLKGRRAILILYVFSMVFYGGMIPAYLVVKTLGILDTYFALILPFVIIQFNMLIIKNYFEGLPESIEESARLDGAGYGVILFRIVCPVSKPVIATVSLLYAVNYWNNYFHAMLYTSSASMKTLQLFLYDMVYSSEQITEKISAEPSAALSVEGVRSAAIILSILPIIAVYPYIQKYFVQGITIGSVKG